MSTVHLDTSENYSDKNSDNISDTLLSVVSMLSVERQSHSLLSSQSSKWINSGTSEVYSTSHTNSTSMLSLESSQSLPTNTGHSKLQRPNFELNVMRTIAKFQNPGKHPKYSSRHLLPHLQLHIPTTLNFVLVLIHMILR